ncbi:MAG TPA: amidohydrolase family protein, partial [Candidatus Hydrogenedentes bacterium]|nr:amidohydrolase family protein [Candidatus Hydrogenedentota bacterium]
ALAITITELVEPGLISIEKAVDLMTRRPAEILGLPAGALREGGPADIAVFDPHAEWTVDPAQFASLSRNTPFAGRVLRGVIRATLCDGRIVHRG